MTNLEAIKSTAIGYPVEESVFERILLDRGLSGSESYAGKSKAFELAKADVYVTLLTAANITEGGLQVSLTDKSNFMKVASGIYDRYGEFNPLKERQPEISSISPW